MGKVILIYKSFESKQPTHSILALYLFCLKGSILNFSDENNNLQTMFTVVVKNVDRIVLLLISGLSNGYSLLSIIVYIGVWTPLKNTPLFLAKPPSLNLQTVQALPFYVGFSWTPLKVGFFREPQTFFILNKILSFKSN